MVHVPPGQVFCQPGDSSSVCVGVCVRVCVRVRVRVRVRVGACTCGLSVRTPKSKDLAAQILQMFY